MGYNFLISNMKITLTFAILALFCAAVSCEIAVKEEKKDSALSDKTSKDTVLDENTDENKKTQSKDTVLDENTDENKKEQAKDDDFFSSGSTAVVVTSEDVVTTGVRVGSTGTTPVREIGITGTEHAELRLTV